MASRVPLGRASSSRSVGCAISIENWYCAGSDPTVRVHGQDAICIEVESNLDLGNTTRDWWRSSREVDVERPIGLRVKVTGDTGNGSRTARLSIGAAMLLLAQSKSAAR